jgi:hypothetical protein
MRRGIRLNAISRNGWSRGGSSAGLETSLTGSIEGTLECIVERPQPHLISRTERSAGADEVSACPALLLSNNRAQYSIEGDIERLHDWMVLVEPAAIYPDHDLWSRPV